VNEDEYIIVIVKTCFNAVLWVRWQESTWRHLHEGYLAILACKTSSAAINYQIYQMPPRELPTVTRQGLFYLKNLLKPPIYPQGAIKFVL